jgi:hypothetical protein
LAREGLLSWAVANLNVQMATWTTQTGVDPGGCTWQEGCFPNRQ